MSFKTARSPKAWDLPRRFPTAEGRYRRARALGSSGFANTDLDQQLKQFGIQRVIVIGMIARTCIEATGRFAVELGLPRHLGEGRDRRLER
jgi:nicotinamidase-related amidase